MIKPEIAETVKEIFWNVLDDDSLELTEEMTAADVEGWDSLTHIGLIASIEKHYKIRFSLAEIDDLKNVGEIMGAIQKKIQK
jgi:acyl carrier protein